jgi:hypothetical protein
VPGPLHSGPGTLTEGSVLDSHAADRQVVASLVKSVQIGVVEVVAACSPVAEVGRVAGVVVPSNHRVRKARALLLQLKPRVLEPVAAITVLRRATGEPDSRRDIVAVAILPVTRLLARKPPVNLPLEMLSWPRIARAPTALTGRRTGRNGA